MGNITKKLSNRFSIFDNRIMQDKRLDLNAKGLYSYILSLPDDWQFSIERVARANNTTEGKVKKAISDLEEVGLLKREYTLNKNERGRRASYIVFDFDSMIEVSTPKNLSIEKVGVYINNNITKKEFNKEINIQAPLVSSANATETLPPKGESEFELKPEEKEVSSSKAKNEYTPEFEIFWKIYKTKRSEGKAPAFKQWLKAIKKIKPEDLIKALEAHIREWDFRNTHAQYIPHAKTWLSQERFLDELDNKQDYGSHSIYYGDGETTF